MMISENSLELNISPEASPLISKCATEANDRVNVEEEASHRTCVCSSSVCTCFHITLSLTADRKEEECVGADCTVLVSVH